MHHARAIRGEWRGGRAWLRRGLTVRVRQKRAGQEVSKATLERTVLEHGGRVVQNAGAATEFVVAQSEMAHPKARRLRSGG